MVGAGRGVLRACFNRTPRSLPACLPLSPLVWVGRAKMKGGKVQVTHWPPRQTHPGGGRGKADWEILLSHCLRAHSDSFCYYFLNSEVNCLETRCITEANNSWRLDGKNVMQRLHTKDRGFRLNPPHRFLLLLLSTLNHPESEWLPWGRGWKSPELENQRYF